jgi:Uma2 family endonuclease
MSAVPNLPLPRHRLTVADYYRMAEAGIFGEDDRVELIEGEIFDMPPLGVDHVYTVNRLTTTFVLRAGLKAMVSVQNPIGLGLTSEPQPDISLLRYRADYYRHIRPGP